MYTSRMKLSKELVAASAGALVLSILEQGESYGYEIIRRVKELSAGQIQWTDGMLYPVLHRLEEQGAVTSRWRESETGRKRKYYALQGHGRKVLADHKAQWLVVHGALSTIWGTHVRA
jgi:PadR family transcriptional regulator PadR